MFYVYVWRDGVGVPFYVGKGKGNRANNTIRRSNEFKQVHAFGGCAVDIVDWFIHESQAHALEIELIERFGRREFGGSLVNKTDGGEGTSGFSPSMSTRTKQSLSMTGRKLSQEHKDKIGASQKGRVFTIEHLAKIGQSIRRRFAEVGMGERIGERNKLSPPMKRNTSGLKGVTYQKATNKWAAKIGTDGVRKHLGLFASGADAAAAYDKAAIEAWGIGNCYLNFPEERAA